MQYISTLLVPIDVFNSMNDGLVSWKEAITGSKVYVLDEKSTLTQLLAAPW